MGKVGVIVDSNSGITQQQGSELGLHILPMPFFIDGEMFFEDITLTQEEFYKRLGDNSDIKTSQPAPADVMAMWDRLLKEYDEIVHIPMSKSLSGSCETALALADDYDGRIVVVDNQRISITQRHAALTAVHMAGAGKGAQEIKEVLEKEALEASIYLGVDTLKYLKKGGRVTPAAAALGTVLNIKPVLEIQGGKLDAFAKVRGFKAAKKVMLDAMEKDVKERFVNTPLDIMIAHSQQNEEIANEWKREVEDRFPDYDIYMAPLALSVACHTGPGVLAVGCAKKLSV